METSGTPGARAVRGAPLRRLHHKNIFSKRFVCWNTYTSRRA
jgi:hypothetical protein